MASAHGALGLLTLPIAGFAAKNGVNPDSIAAITAVYGCFVLLVASVIYSIKALRELGYLHFLHIFTVAGGLATHFVAALIVGGPG